MYRGAKDVFLTRTEHELLRCLAVNAGKVLSHRKLLREVRGRECREETEYLRTFINQLRRKLEPNPSRPVHLVTQAQTRPPRGGLVPHRIFRGQVLGHMAPPDSEGARDWD